ncbi:ABC transporter permease [Salibacterium qingdaonense]|uniref:ABC-2 type transport system permease protein n=1 Tax=Salibacterium qingdaonense TaxID=266892 RepID=A0A1I4JBE7_9BACI|nr:ABC transporter permease [Salibacterium qingdaonense]SFL63912.1 ABC-2 type transport system permease protein [Salibacterium qingdaonense]
MNIESLWKDRVQTFWNQAVRYLRLIGNSGFMFSLYALFLAGGYFYPSFMEWLPSSVPVSLLFTLLFAYLLTRCPLRTFLKEGDLVFLLPLESRLKSYFTKSVIYSYVFQSAAVVIVFLLLGPLFRDRVVDDNMYMYTSLFLLLLINGWNYASFWAETRFQEEMTRFKHTAGRAVLNAAAAYLLFQGAPLWFPAAVVLVCAFVYIFYYYPLLRRHLLKWEVLLQQEEKRVSAFYRFVRSFTDVGHVKTRVKRRRWLNAPLDRWVWNKGSVFMVLFGKSFMRSGEYLGMYVRLILAAGLVMYAFPNDWFRMAAAFLFLYMTSVQLRALWHHLDVTIWPDLYPVAHVYKQNDFKALVKTLLAAQTILLTLVYLLTSGSLLPGVVLIGAGLALCFLYPLSKKDRAMIQNGREA